MRKTNTNKELFVICYKELVESFYSNNGREELPEETIIAFINGWGGMPLYTREALIVFLMLHEWTWNPERRAFTLNRTGYIPAFRQVIKRRNLAQKIMRGRRSLWKIMERWNCIS
jgi:hypothetical protein